jgi:hypothetical protein
VGKLLCLIGEGDNRQSSIAAQGHSVHLAARVCVRADAQLRSMAEGLIELEEDLKYRKKYAMVWRTAKAPGRLAPLV